MDFRVDEDQAGAARRDPLLLRGAGAGSTRSASSPPNGLDRALWRDLAEMGVFQLRLPEARGGLGLGMSEAVLVFAELGRRLVPGPLVWSHLAAELIPGAASGEVVVGGLDRMRARAPSPC